MFTVLRRVCIGNFPIFSIPMSTEIRIEAWHTIGNWPELNHQFILDSHQDGFMQTYTKSNDLTHWGRVTHICVGKLTIIGSDNGLAPGRRQAIIWTNARIYIMISKNIRNLLWNRGAWRFFHDTYLTIEVQRIRCTNHLHDSCPFTDVNPHFTAPGCRYYFKINSWWPIVTS